MHEAGIAMEIIAGVEAALEDRPGFKATRIFVTVGRLQNVDPASLRFAFDILAKESPSCAGAELVFEEAAARGECSLCAWEGPLPNEPWVCPECKNTKIDISGAWDLLLRSIDAQEVGKE